MPFCFLWCHRCRLQLGKGLDRASVGILLNSHRCHLAVRACLEQITRAQGCILHLCDSLLPPDPSILRRRAISYVKSSEITMQGHVPGGVPSPVIRPRRRMLDRSRKDGWFARGVNLHRTRTTAGRCRWPMLNAVKALDARQALRLTRRRQSLRRKCRLWCIRRLVVAQATCRGTRVSRVRRRVPCTPP